MKRLLLCTVGLVCFTLVKAQTATSQTVAASIAQKMKDSLGLSDSQKSQLYALNVQIAGNKVAVRQQNTNPDSVRIKMQRIENTRDSLYATVLTSGQFAVYQQKKAALVRAN